MKTIRTKLLSFRSSFLLWLRGYVVIPKFLSIDDCIRIREYVEGIQWPVGSSNMKHGSLCSSSDGEYFSFYKCFFDEQISKSLSILESETQEEFLDVGLRTIQLRMHSPIWHIDVQTFNNDKPLIARDRRFNLYKCGVYLQGESESGGGTLEIRQPFGGGGIKNILTCGDWKNQNTRIIQLCIKLFGVLSDATQFLRKRLALNAGDLIIFNGSLMHRASQKHKKSTLVKDPETGYFVDTSDLLGKIMLQWEFVTKNDFGNEYRTHALLKHGVQTR